MPAVLTERPTAKKTADNKPSFSTGEAFEITEENKGSKK